MSYLIEVILTDGETVKNDLRFPSKQDAERYASDLASRWSQVSAWQILESRVHVSATWDDDGLLHLNENAP